MSGPATPHAPLSARASLPPTGTATPALQLQSQPTAPGLPPPQAFDILPDLHVLLGRLTKPAADPSAPTPTPGQHKDLDDQPLEIRELGTEAQKIKRKIEMARDKVMALPDIDRTIEDQEDEIEDLEGRIAKLKAALQRLGAPAKEVADEDTSMTG